MAVTAEDLALFIGLPPDNAENVQRYLDAARSKARGAGIRDFSNNAHYDMFLLNLGAMYYDNRGMAFSGSSGYRRGNRTENDKFIRAFSAARGRRRRVRR